MRRESIVFQRPEVSSKVRCCPASDVRIQIPSIRTPASGLQLSRPTGLHFVPVNSHGKTNPAILKTERFERFEHSIRTRLNI